MQADQALGAKRADGQVGARSIAIALPFLTRMRYWARMKFLQILVDTLLVFRRLPKSDEPTYTKTYPVRPEIGVRVFIPSSFKSGQSKPLPLYIDTHGGGFVVCNAKVDDRDNAILAHEHGICCVAISYRRGPSYGFPTAVHDCADLIEAILADKDLDGIVDKTKVAVGGYSAGGNLSLASVQLNGLSKRIKGVVAVYPVVDFSTSSENKLKTSKVAPGKKADRLADLAPMFNYAYVPAGTDYRNPLLSPAYAARDKLPEKLCLIGCEYDMLCEEAKDMAEKLAEQEEGEKRVSPDGNSWEKGRIRWEFITEAEHGFNQPPPDASEEEKRRGREKQLAMHRNIADWLKREVYA